MLLDARVPADDIDDFADDGTGVPIPFSAISGPPAIAANVLPTPGTRRCNTAPAGAAAGTTARTPSKDTDDVSACGNLALDTILNHDHQQDPREPLLPKVKSRRGASSPLRDASYTKPDPAAHLPKAYSHPSQISTFLPPWPPSSHGGHNPPSPPTWPTPGRHRHADIRDSNLARVGHAPRHALPREYRSEASQAFESTCTWLTMPSKRICPSLSYGVPRSTFVPGHSRKSCAPAVSTAGSQHNCFLLSFVKERLASRRSNAGRMIDYIALLGGVHLHLAREVRSAGPTHPT